MSGLRSGKSDSPEHPSNRRQTLQANNTASVTFLPGRPPSLILWSALYFFLGFLAVLVVGLWARQQTGGLEWADVDQPGKMFSYHPFFMTLGLLYIHGFGNLMYRLFPGGNYLAVRIVHGLLQATAVILAGMGIYAVYFFKEHTHFRRRIFHFTSVHSWLGLTTITLVGLQWVCGFFGLLLPGLPPHWFHRYRTIHKFVGKTLFFLICGTVLVGIDQLGKASTSLNITAYIVILYTILGGYMLFERQFETNGPEGAPGTDTSGERAPMLATVEVDDL